MSNFNINPRSGHTAGMELPLRCGGEVLFRHEQLLDERHRRASMTPSWNGGLGGSLAMVLLMCLVLPPKSRSSAFVMRGNRDGHSSAASISTAAGRSNTACSRDSNRLGRNILAFSVGSVLGPTNRGRARLEKLNKRRVSAGVRSSGGAPRFHAVRENFMVSCKTLRRSCRHSGTENVGCSLVHPKARDRPSGGRCWTCYSYGSGYHPKRAKCSPVAI